MLLLCGPRLPVQACTAGQPQTLPACWRSVLLCCSHCGLPALGWPYFCCHAGFSDAERRGLPHIMAAYRQKGTGVCASSHCSQTARPGQPVWCTPAHAAAAPCCCCCRLDCVLPVPPCAAFAGDKLAYFEALMSVEEITDEQHPAKQSGELWGGGLAACLRHALHLSTLARLLCSTLAWLCI